LDIYRVLQPVPNGVADRIKPARAIADRRAVLHGNPRRYLRGCQCWQVHEIFARAELLGCGTHLRIGIGRPFTEVLPKCGPSQCTSTAIVNSSGENE
jgi:hypothetical protein